MSVSVACDGCDGCCQTRRRKKREHAVGEPKRARSPFMMFWCVRATATADVLGVVDADVIEGLLRCLHCSVLVGAARLSGPG